MNIDKIHKDIDSIEIQTPAKREKQLDESQLKIPGFTLFSFNKETKEVKPAEYLKVLQDYHVKSLKFNVADIQVRYTLVIEPNCIYKQRLNKKSFIKWLKENNYVV